MIDKKDVIEFFDRLAPGWDAQQIRNDEVIGVILDNAGIKEGIDVLDVACGTGVLFPDYMARNVGSVTGVDISPEMAGIAAEKYSGDEQIKVVCADVEEFDFGRQFDAVMVYNAFPHFQDPERLIKCLSGLVKEGGSVTVAHGMSRECIDAHHKGCAHHVSNGLMEAKKLKEIFAPYLEVTTVISDERMYQVTGMK